MIRWIFVFLVVTTGVGCATVKDHHAVGLERLAASAGNDLITDKEGLTIRGCEIFFPDQEGVVCVTAWRRLAFSDRVAFMRTYGSPVIRGVWESSRFTEVVEHVARMYPSVSHAAVQEVVREIGRNPYATCAGLGLQLEDLCFFGFSEIATPEEVEAALRYLESAAREKSNAMTVFGASRPPFLHREYRIKNPAIAPRR